MQDKTSACFSLESQGFSWEVFFFHCQLRRTFVLCNQNNEESKSTSRDRQILVKRVSFERISIFLVFALFTRASFIWMPHLCCLTWAETRLEGRAASATGNCRREEEKETAFQLQSLFFSCRSKTCSWKRYAFPVSHSSLIHPSLIFEASFCVSFLPVVSSVVYFSWKALGFTQFYWKISSQRSNLNLLSFSVLSSSYSCLSRRLWNLPDNDFDENRDHSTEQKFVVEKEIHSFHSMIQTQHPLDSTPISWQFKPNKLPEEKRSSSSSIEQTRLSTFIIFVIDDYILFILLLQHKTVLWLQSIEETQSLCFFPVCLQRLFFIVIVI